MRLQESTTLPCEDGIICLTYVTKARPGLMLALVQLQPSHATAHYNSNKLEQQINDDNTRRVQ